MTASTNVVNQGQPQVMDKNKMGMICFIASEIIFFGLLIMAYVYFRIGNNETPNARTDLNPGLTAIFTACLLSSSLTIWMAERSLKAYNRRGLIIWLVATVGLGAIFLIGQGIEYANLLSDKITPGRNLFGTTFFTLTGFHGLHVFGGLVLLSLVAGFAIAGDYRNSNHSTALDAISIYWHFVDVVWVVIFTLVYFVLR